MSPNVDFVESHGSYFGAGADGRAWHITRVFAGWRLEFRDGGEADATFAGVHGSLGAAQAEASRTPSRGGGRHGRGSR
jgi:hypothetical protein